MTVPHAVQIASPLPESSSIVEELHDGQMRPILLNAQMNRVCSTMASAATYFTRFGLFQT